MINRRSSIRQQVQFLKDSSDNKDMFITGEILSIDTSRRPTRVTCKWYIQMSIYIQYNYYCIIYNNKQYASYEEKQYQTN